MFAPSSRPLNKSREYPVVESLALPGQIRPAAESRHCRPIRCRVPPDICLRRPLRNLVAALKPRVRRGLREPDLLIRTDSPPRHRQPSGAGRDSRTELRTRPADSDSPLGPVSRHNPGDHLLRFPKEPTLSRGI